MDSCPAMHPGTDNGLPSLLVLYLHPPLNLIQGATGLLLHGLGDETAFALVSILALWVFYSREAISAKERLLAWTGLSYAMVIVLDNWIDPHGGLMRTLQLTDDSSFLFYLVFTIGTVLSAPSALLDGVSWLLVSLLGCQNFTVFLAAFALYSVYEMSMLHVAEGAFLWLAAAIGLQTLETYDPVDSVRFLD